MRVDDVSLIDHPRLILKAAIFGYDDTFGQCQGIMFVFKATALVYHLAWSGGRARLLDIVSLTSGSFVASELRKVSPRSRCFGGCSV